MSTFLLEIGTEELPADFARLALHQLEQLVQRDLGILRLSHNLISCTSTPRRLVVSVTGLPLRQPDLKEERKGPPGAQALTNGQPTAAAIGFAKRCGVSLDALEIRETPKGPFLFASCLEPGQPTTNVLATQVSLWIEALQGRRFMRWGEGKSRFSRPVRWLVSLLDTELVPVSLDGGNPVVAAGRVSRGHRLHQASVLIPSAETYSDVMRAAGVEVDRDRRGELIRSAVETAASMHSADADMPETLFQELIDLVESPTLLQGQFDLNYLDLPAEVLSTVMRSHQRYIPLFATGQNLDPLALDARGCLLPRFLFISNGLPEAATSVARGNERVLKARLSDAEFFMRADRSVASIERRAQLARVTFAEGLGSLLDRTERIEWCTEVLLQQLELPSSCEMHARRAAHLCKHDLVSQIVGEFPELQGAMGGKYLVAEGEPHQVGLAVLEHYLPRGAGDALPSSDAGAVVALSERLELLLSIYAKGERPTGSSDPYGLRRAGQGLLQILWAKSWRLDLLDLLNRFCEHWAELMPHYTVDVEKLATELADFLRQRLVSLLEEDGMDIDLVQAVAGQTGDQARVLSDPEDARQRVALLMELRSSGQLTAVQAVVTRAARLASQADLPSSVLTAKDVVSPELFEKSSEASMLAVLNMLEPFATCSTPDRYRSLASGLSAGAPALAAFFDGEQSVMVMAEDGAVRSNRLNLLGVLRNQASVLADFSRIGG
ncbi:MAG: glycine--tRNA ligase subunit beta [Cyanobacteria bacterium]|nr:glycine--tRNA ligase subunit beta [Cyanobacteriota bacterium]MDA1245861.1 glycine--tRNA ligase subunit beta [Cyanobacteriota bacterium]